MKFIKRYCWVLVALIILFIFMNSFTPAISSKELSSTVTTFVYQQLSNLHIQTEYETLHHFIRKLAHFSEYSFLGFVIAYACLNKPFIKSKIVNFGFFFIVPCIDESIQWFTPGRSCEFTDVLIDSSGIVFGCLMFLLLLKLVNKYKFHKQKKEV